MAKPTVDLKNRYLAAFLAWIVPGLGHFYQRRTGKGILYCSCVLGLFVLGLFLGDWQVVYWQWVSPTTSTEKFCFNYLGQFGAGFAALPALIQSTLTWYGYDTILWGFMAAPLDPNVMNARYEPRGKLLEMGSLFTTIAGLLNILAIYDAFEGPANLDEPEPTKVSAPTSAAAAADDSKGDLIVTGEVVG